MLLRRHGVGRPPAFLADLGMIHSHSSLYHNKLPPPSSHSTISGSQMSSLFTHLVLTLVLDTPSRGADGARTAALWETELERGTRDEVLQSRR